MDLTYLIRAGLGIPDYWHPRLEMRTDFLSGRIGRYPISKDVKADYPGGLDAAGVPVMFSQGKPCSPPVDIILYGLGSHDMYIATGEKRYYQQVMNVLLWLRNNSVPLGEGVGWPNSAPLPEFGLKPPWFSGIVQGFALSLFVRAYQLEGAHPWSRLAYQTWLGYHTPVEKGGFCRKLQPGVVIYEEYPGPSLDFVFNGMCYALIGLWESCRSGLVTEAQEDFDHGLQSLCLYLPRFDFGQWSLYSLNESLGKAFLASPYYHRVNGLLAQVLGLMAARPDLSMHGERWVKASKSLTRRIGMSLRIGLDRYRHSPSLLHSDRSKSPAM